MQKHKILIASFLTILVAGVGTAVRGGLLIEWGENFGFTQTELGTITGGGFVGFGLVIFIASLFLDKFGYKPFLLLAGLLHIVSVVVTVAATSLYAGQIDTNPEAAKDAAFQCLFWGIFLFSIANGICEAVVNPLIATIYPKEKTHYLNILHAGWPGGLIVGSLLGLVLTGSVRWEIVLGLYAIPTLIYILMIVKEKFPKSEAAEAGVSFGDMLKEFAAPMLIFLLALHVLIGYVELGTDAWISAIMNEAFSGNGLLVLLYTSALMFILRFFAGPIVHRINPLGLLFVSAVLATIGLYSLGTFRGVAAILVAATVYGCGKTFFWPTMLGVVSERFPRGGALTLGAVGAAGMLSAGLLGGPGIGYTQDRHATNYLTEQSQAVYDEFKGEDVNSFLIFPPVQGLDNSKVGPLLGMSDEELSDDEKLARDAYNYGGRTSLQTTAALPAALAIGFLLLIIYFRSQGGYKPIELSGSSGDEDAPATTE